MPTGKIVTQARTPRYNVRILRNIHIPSSTPDATLVGDLYLPETNETVPALVSMHSTGKDELGGMNTKRFHRFFASQGYASVFVDCYGMGGSQGEPRPMLGLGEAEDGAALVEWAARQPWCSGSVGMWGLSHAAMTTLATASLRPPHLRAIVPIMGLTDPGHELIHPGGLRAGLGFYGMLGTHNVLCSLMPPLRDPDAGHQTATWRHRVDSFEPWVVDAWRHPPGDTAWADRRTDPARIMAPAFCVAGWRDLFCDGMIEAYEQIDAPKRLLVGPWLHDFPDKSPIEPVDSITMACDWWDHWLGGAASGTASGRQAVTIFVQGGDARWSQLDTWPPSHVEEWCLVTEVSGSLATIGKQHGLDRPAARTTPVIYRSDPTVGALSGLWKDPVVGFGYPLDQHDDDNRSLAFTSAPLSEPFLVIGQPTARLVIGHGTTVSRCVIKLVDVDEAGRSSVVSVGTLKLDDSMQRRGPSKSAPWHVALGRTCHEFAQGHRVRMVLTDADFPRLWPSQREAEIRLITMADGHHPYMANNGDSQLATALMLPTCSTGSLPECSPPRPAASRKHGAKRAFPAPVWEVSRDHVRNTVRVTVGSTVGGFYIPGSENLIEREIVVSAEVARHDPGDARLVATGRCVTKAENGSEVVVTSDMEITHNKLLVSGEVGIDGQDVFKKQWTN